MDVLLDIEVQGAAKVRARCPDALFIFIIPQTLSGPQSCNSRRPVPPPGAAGWYRTQRNKYSEDVIAGRLEKARVELKEIPSYDYLVINDKPPRSPAHIGWVLFPKGPSLRDTAS